MPRLVSCLAVGLSLFLLILASGCTSPYQEKVVGTWDTDLPDNPNITMAKDGSGFITVVVQGQAKPKAIKWRLRGTNLIFTIDGKEKGGIIKSADEKRIILNDPSVKKDFTFTRAAGS